VRAVTEVGLALLLLASATTGFAQEAATDDEEGWSLESLRLRFTFFDQRGRGAQSQADPEVGADGIERGRMDADIYQPMMQFGVRQSDRVTHTLSLPVDIVTSASADALDAVSSASRVTESFSVDLTSTVSATNDDHLSLRYGLHIEEPFKSGFGGFAYRRDLAQDNTVLEARGFLTVDVFDPITPQGFDVGLVKRYSLLGSLAVTQVLSRTTLLMLSYGLTHQWGTLQNTWNAVPVAGDGLRVAEIFPRTRTRHAASVEVAQHVPASRTTVRLRYRYYRDDFGVQAHSAQGTLYQWLGPRAYFGITYRHHQQTAVDFFTELAPANAHEEDQPRTADADLAAYTAHQLGGKLVLYLQRDGSGGSESLNLGYHRYWRPRLDVDLVSIGYERLF